MLKTLVATLALASVPLISAAKDAHRIDAKDVWLPYDYTPLTDADKALKDVPFAPGAPAVLLFVGQQEERTGTGDTRIHYHRRVKVLTKEGVKDAGEFTYSLYGDWRIKASKARTILPDQTIIDVGEGLVRTKSEGARKTEQIQIVFPRVEPGAILDIYLEFQTEDFYMYPWTVSQELPVLESRFILLPDPALRFRSAVVHLPQELSQPLNFPMRAMTGFCWRFKDVPALPDVPNSPADEDISARLLLLTDSYSYGGAVYDLGSSWKTWISDIQGRYETWLKRKPAQAQALAATACAGKTTAREKAEAIRRAVQDRVRHEYDDWYPDRKTVDEVLTEGSGGSGDVAGLTIAMLRSQGVQAFPAAVRRRSSGAVPADIPVPALFDHCIVRVEDGGPGFWFDATASVMAGTPEWDTTGILAAVFRKGADAPIPIPDFTAEQNQTTSSVDASLSADGRLDATVTLDYIGIAASAWREDMAGLTAQEQEQEIRDTALDFAPGAEFKLLGIKGLDPGDEMVEIRYQIGAAGYGTVAGKRLLVNPLLVNRVATSDWAAEKREIPVDLGGAFLEDDTVRLKFPEGIVSGQLPDAQRYNAEPTGFYDVTFEPAKDGRSVTVRRKFRMDVFTFAPESYGTLRKWHLDMAGMDDRPITLSFP